ncbi:conserved protein, unknown function, partial [Hepatocystis sp. ex Piliocolobus tephrosceles]
MENCKPKSKSIRTLSSINKRIFELKNVEKKKNTLYVSKYKTEKEVLSTCDYKKNKNFLVQFICQAKDYDLIQISNIFLCKNINHKFFDNHNILCAFLSLEKLTRNSYSFEDIYNINNITFKKNINYKNAEFLFFIFKNGSIIIWDNSGKLKENEYYINKTILFLNSYSHSLLPLCAIQTDNIYYRKQYNYISHEKQIQPDQIKPDQIKPDQIKPDQIKPDQIKPDQIKPDQIKPDQI